MAMEYFKGKVKENIELVEGIYSLVVEHEAKINAGQFYMIKTPNTFLGRPISVCEVMVKMYALCMLLLEPEQMK